LEEKHKQWKIFSFAEHGSFCRERSELNEVPNKYREKSAADEDCLALCEKVMTTNEFFLA